MDSNVTEGLNRIFTVHHDCFLAYQQPEALKPYKVCALQLVRGTFDAWLQGHTFLASSVFVSFTTIKARKGVQCIDTALQLVNAQMGAYRNIPFLNSMTWETLPGFLSWATLYKRPSLA